MESCGIISVQVDEGVKQRGRATRRSSPTSSINVNITARSLRIAFRVHFKVAVTTVLLPNGGTARACL